MRKTLLSWSGGCVQWVLTRATHRFKIGHVPSGYCCSGAQGDGCQEAISQSWLALALAPGLTRQRRCFGIVGCFRSQGGQIRDSVSIELGASLPQTSVANRMDSKQELPS